MATTQLISQNLVHTSPLSFNPGKDVTIKTQKLIYRGYSVDYRPRPVQGLLPIASDEGGDRPKVSLIYRGYTIHTYRRPLLANRPAAHKLNWRYAA